MRILLVQTSFPGDTVLSTALIAALHNKYPGCELWMLTTKQSAELVVRDPLLRGVLTFDKRAEDSGVVGLLKLAAKIRSMAFDRVYSLHRSARTSILLYLSKIPHRVGFSSASLGFFYNERVPRQVGGHEVERNLSILKDNFTEQDKQIRLFALEQSQVFKNFEINPDKRYAVVTPGSVWPTKRWSAEGYREVCVGLLSKGLDVLVLGAKNEAAVSATVSNGIAVRDLAGKTTLSEFITLIKYADVVVCNDSLALHVASAFKRRVVCVFGATTTAFGFGPWQTAARVVERVLDCRPCSRHGSKKCPIGTFNCMRDISAGEVLAAVAEVGI